METRRLEPLTRAVNSARVSTSGVDRPSTRLVETGYPSTRAVNSGRQLG